MMRKTIILSALLSLTFEGMLADVPNDSIPQTIELDQVVVTGTRTPKLLANTPVLTKLITANDIMKTDATNLRDVLQQIIPGVEFSYAMNQQVHMNFSGFGGQSMLILVDGERLAGETMDDVDFTRIGMENVDHIEIVKGAASALYGSNAAGGVINIITKKKPNPCALNLNMRFGRHHEQRYGLSWQYARGKWNNLLTFNTLNSPMHCRICYMELIFYTYCKHIPISYYLFLTVIWHCEYNLSIAWNGVMHLARVPL